MLGRSLKQHSFPAGAAKPGDIENKKRTMGCLGSDAYLGRTVLGSEHIQVSADCFPS